MALLTKAQREQRDKKQAENRTYTLPVYANHPNSKKVQAGEATANQFTFQGNEYESVEMVAITRRYVYQTGTVPDTEEVTIFSDDLIDETPTFHDLVAEHEKVKCFYETLVYLPELKAFAAFRTPSYSTEVNKAFEDGEDGEVFRVTPNIHCPPKSRYSSMLYLYTVEATGEVCNPEENELYNVEFDRFNAF